MSDNGKNKKLRPKTFYDEMAEYGYLDDYIRSVCADRFGEDKEFRNEIVDTLMIHSGNVVPEVEFYYLKKLRKSLDLFLKRNRLWKKPRP